MISTLGQRTLRRAAIALAALGLAGAPAYAMETEDCLGCHADRSIVDQGGAHLYIDQANFAQTPHAEQGCSACHASVGDSHPDDRVRPSRAKCDECHDDVVAEYAKSAHSAAATCNDCHNPHAVRSPTAVSGQDINRQCANCHDRTAVLVTHGKWLPQAELHLDGLPCISCHTASKQYVITFYIEKRGGKGFETNFHLATPADLAQVAPSKGPAQRLIDRNGDNFISLDELRRFNKSADNDELRLRGTMMPEKVPHDFVTLDNRWDCTFCHVSGPDARQTSYVAFPEEGARYSRLPVEKGAVLDVVYGSPDFYMLGATRNDTLSIVGLAIVACGLAVPIGHGSLRFLTRRNRKED